MSQKDLGITVADVEGALDAIKLPQKKRRRFWEALGINPDINQSEELPNLTAERDRRNPTLNSDSTTDGEGLTSIQRYALASRISHLLLDFGIKTNRGIRRVKAEVLTAVEKGNSGNLSEAAMAILEVFKHIPRDRRLPEVRAVLQIVNRNGNSNNHQGG